ncbi:response regulator [Belnapia sp. T6]|uniref:histidine kinase n=1 Tax=Belnapia mucosa TaxID=2804532 RepID=A0ABS1V985_9PROT|nr:response regulator [Belnapia mucosa]MBL6458230.1 response regulator [Belnapia mucosa]
MTTILVVDDEPDLEALILQRFRRRIRARELAFLFARDGIEALDFVAHHADIGLVLADINMPRMDGLTLLGELQKTVEPLATVVISAYGDMGNIRTAMNRGAFDFLTKPIDFADLETTIAKTQRHVAALREARAAAAELQHQREALLQAEKMATFGSLLAGVAHELNNPLSIVLAGALMLEEEAAEISAPGLARSAERIRVAAERCARIVRSFLAMARQQEVQRRPIVAAVLVDGALELLAYGLRSDGIEVTRDVPADLPPLLGDADQLHQVLANLITNAKQALEHQPGPRHLRIAARAGYDAVEISVADNGPGIAAELRGRIFDPFFTTKPVGTGIGLAVSRRIADAHGGSLTLAEGDGGARFILRLPRAGLDAAAPAMADPPPDAAPPAVPRTALVIDDEAELAGVLVRMLAVHGFRCDFAVTGREARDLLSRSEYDAILCDLRMPDMDGQALYCWLERQRPHLCRRTAFVTGDALSRVAAEFLARSGRPVLEKPFLPEEVRRLVATLDADSG